MALRSKYHTLSSWTGVNYATTSTQSMTDSATSIPEAGVLTASGDRPSTAVYVNYDGAKNIAIPSLNYRCERGIGITMSEGQVYWADFYAKFETFASSSELHNDFSQVRDSASPDPGPSPSPAFSNVNGNATVIRNLYTNSGGSAGPTLTYGAGSMDVGGDWHHWQIGFKWSAGSDGWFEAWRDGVQTLSNTSIRTARATAGASWRWGIYRNPGFAGSPVRWRLWGLEIHDTRPDAATGPDPGTGTDTTGPTLSILDPVASAVITGNIRYTIDVSDTESGVASVEYSLIGPSPATTKTVIFTESSAPWDDSDDFDPFDTTQLDDGDYTFRVIATDADGNSTTANQSVVLDNFTDPPPVNLPPFGVVVPSNRTPYIDEEVIFYLGTSDDGGDGNLTYEWDLTGALTFADSTSKTPAPTYTYTSPGIYVVRCRITDSGGLQYIASATVTSSERPGAPDPTDPPPDPTVPPTPGFVTRGNVGIAIDGPSTRR